MKKEIYFYSADEVAEAIEKLEKSISSAPKDRFRVSSGNTRLETYLIGADGKRIGLSPKRDQDVACMKKLAQRDYEKRLLRLFQKLGNMQKYLDRYMYICEQISDCYNNLSDARRALVVPFKNEDEEKLEKWLSKTYPPKDDYANNLIIVTDRGDMVRSKSEKMIADRLYAKGVYYKYEKPLVFNGVGRIYPDFTIYNPHNGTEYYLEHFGMVDDPKYRNDMFSRINTYRLNQLGDRLLMTFETLEKPLDTREVDELIRAYDLAP